MYNTLDITIQDPDNGFKLEIIQWNAITLEYFRIYSDKILDAHEKKKVTKAKEEPPKKAPDNTALFMHWVAEKNIKRFALDRLLKECPIFNKDTALAVISFQITKKNILQLSSGDNPKFEVLK